MYLWNAYIILFMLGIYFYYLFVYLIVIYVCVFVFIFHKYSEITNIRLGKNKEKKYTY